MSPITHPPGPWGPISRHLQTTSSPRSSKHRQGVFECVCVCLIEGGGCSSRARVLHQARVQGISTSFPSPSLCTREALEPVLSAPLNTHTYSRVYLLLPTSSTLFSLILTLCCLLKPWHGSPSFHARSPGQLPALAWVVGWGRGIWGHWSCPLVLLQPCLLIHPSLPAHRSIALLS